MKKQFTRYQSLISKSCILHTIRRPLRISQKNQVQNKIPKETE